MTEISIVDRIANEKLREKLKQKNKWKIEKHTLS